MLYNYKLFVWKNHGFLNLNIKNNCCIKFEIYSNFFLVLLGKQK